MWTIKTQSDEHVRLARDDGVELFVVVTLPGVQPAAAESPSLSRPGMSGINPAVARAVTTPPK